jgi:hypothetical protein
MVVAKPMTPFDPPFDPETGESRESEINIEVIDPEAVIISEDGDELVIDFDGATTAGDDPLADHNANLVEFLDEGDLQSMAADLVAEFMADRQSRDAWAQAYIQGLDLLGLKIEERTEPWAGAAGMFHPMLAEAVVRFQAQAMGELMPAKGPVETKMIGKVTREKFEQASRVRSELNYLITEEMVEYRDEMEQLTFQLPLAGSAFKKVYYDPDEERPAAVFVPAEDFVVSYGASNLQKCPRYTHVMRKYPNEVRKLQVAGFYRDVDLPDPAPEMTDIEDKYNQISGSDVSTNDDDRHMVLEMHVDLDLPEPFADPDGIALPYVVTIDKSSLTVLSIRRNWYEDDLRRRKRMHFVHYSYLPGMGFYGTGLIHLIGGLTKSATLILRQLVDAGTLANLSAGFKARGARIKGDNTPLRPGEFRDIDVNSGTIKDAIFPIPFKEPSQVLYQLLGNIVDEGRRIGSVADVQVGDISSNAPVGTTLALLERSLKVMSGVQARMHAALKTELKLLARVVHDFMDPEYRFDVGGPFDRVKDFDVKVVDVIPVSDPNASTMAQRIMQYQAALQLAQQAPQLYDMGKLHRQMLEVLGIQDAGDIIKLPDELKPMDPVAENMALLTQSPVKAFLYQDHEAHIATHIAAAQDPKIQQMVGQSPFASAIQAAMAAHITEHLAMQYRKEIEQQLGVALPAEGEQLPEDVEVEVSRAVAMAAEKLLRQNMQQAAQAAAEQEAQNPLTQIQMRELALKETELKHKIDMDTQKLALEGIKAGGNLAVRREEIASADEREAARAGVRLATQVLNNQNEETTASIRAGVELAKEAHRGLVNRKDNRVVGAGDTTRIQAREE